MFYVMKISVALFNLSYQGYLKSWSVTMCMKKKNEGCFTRQLCMSIKW